MVNEKVGRCAWPARKTAWFLKAFTFLVVGNLVMQFQVRQEEAFVREQHGHDYETYCRRVRRWL